MPRRPASARPRRTPVSASNSTTGQRCRPRATMNLPGSLPGIRSYGIQTSRTPLPQPFIPAGPGPIDNMVMEEDQVGIGYDIHREGSEVSSVHEEVIMAIEMRDKGKFGCAYFATEDGVLSLSEDIPNATWDMVEQYVIQIEPTTVLVPRRVPDGLLEFLEGHSQATDSAGYADGFILRVLQSTDFASAAARERLVNITLDIPDAARAVVSTADDGTHFNAGVDTTLGSLVEPTHEAQHIKLIRCGTFINLENDLSVTCAGAILSDLHQRRSLRFLPDGQSAEALFHVRRLETFSLTNCMMVSSETLQCLQIVRSELHPNNQVCGAEPSSNGAKESLSVYGLFHLLAHTPQGRSSLRRMFLRPTLDLGVISERQRTISLFMRPDNVEMLKHIGAVLRKIKNAASSITQLRRGVDSPSLGQSFERGVWATLRDFVAQALQLREIVGSVSCFEPVAIVNEVMEHIHPGELIAVGDLISRNIDFEQSISRHRPSVKSGVDTHLDELKRRYDGMGSFLTTVVNHISSLLPEWARPYIRSCIFFPQLGFLTVVEPDGDSGRGKYEGEGLEGDQWERVFTADGSVCYKNRFMRDLDEQYGDMYCEIGDREVEIIHALARRVLQYEEAIIEASEVCGKVDALVALSKGAEKYGWVCPRVVTEKVLEIKEGRHPLQELCVPSFVPNDCYMGNVQDSVRYKAGEMHSALVLTGPNHSGKSIYLKQAAIIAYLAHVGSFVPAAQATVGLTDKILTRISTRESMSRPESAFSIDLKQIGQAIRSATSRSLVLVDEFGKGTNGEDGAGLLGATLDHFLSLGKESPHLILATHFHELFEGGYLDGYPGLVLAHMEVKTNWGASQTDQITYLFKLCMGYSGSSFGARCAAINGVPKAIVERADAIYKLLARNEDLVVACARLSTEEEKRLEEAEAVARMFVETDFAGEQWVDCPEQEGRARSMLMGMLAVASGNGGSS